MHRYKCWNGPMPTTNIQASVTTSASVKTMLQLSTPTTRQLQVIAWGFSVDAAPGGSANVGRVELLETDVAATVTAHVASGVQPTVPGLPPSLLTLGTANTGYTASAEGATTATRVFDSRQVTDADSGAGPTDFTYQFMPDERPIVAVSKFLRVRVSFTTAVNMITWVCWDE